MPRSLTAVFACVLLLLSMFASSLEVQAQVIFQDSFEEPIEVIDVVLDTTVEPGTSTTTPGGEMEIEATGSSTTQVKVSEIQHEQGLPGLQLEISGGDAVITLPPISQEAQAISRQVFQSRTQGDYVVSYPWTERIYRFSKVESWFDSAGYARIPGREFFQIHHVETHANSTPAISAFFDVPGVQLWSNCSAFVFTCYQTGEPVLFIHGFQRESDPFSAPPNINNNGGAAYWSDFPAVLTSEGYVAFEFKWVTNARFRDVALDLAEAIELIHDRTGKLVHLVAHSFGGILVRTLLQGIAPEDITPDEATLLDMVASRIASVTTIGTPHSGIAEFDTSMHEVDFPSGQDTDGSEDILFGNCKQLSCHVMGENVLGSYVAAYFSLDGSPGELAAELANTVQQLPDVDIQVLIGFSRRRIVNELTFTVTYTAGKGDLLISGWGQRFHPALAVEWEPLLSPASGQANYGAARVVERILGRSAADEPDIQIEPEQSFGSEPTFVPFKHSSGTPGPSFSEVLLTNSDDPHYEHIEPFYTVTEGYHDTVQRVLDWISPPSPPPTGTHPLNDTGIDWCADGSTNNLTCPVAGYLGQDGEFGRDAQARAGTLNKIGAGAAGFDYTKLDANGTPLPAGATSWSCVRDDHTGLIWEVKTDDGGLRDKDHEYTWYNPDPNTNGGFEGYRDGGTCTASSCDTHGFVQAVNAQGLCGANDWRMATRSELQSIVNKGRFNPAIDMDYFPNTLPIWHWSSSPEGYYSSSTWVTSFYSGMFFAFEKGTGVPVRLVRAGQPLHTGSEVTCTNENTAVPATTPTSDFTVLGDGSIARHETTGLEWQRCALGQSWDGATCQGTAGTYTWQQALQAADAQSGWRLPNKNELASIVEQRCWWPVINTTVFPNTRSTSFLTSFWSSSPHANDGGSAWNVYFGYGHVYADPKSYYGQVRLVRGGQ